MSRYRHTDEEFIAACTGSTTYSEIFEKLGMKPGGSNTRTVKKRIAELNLELEGFKGIRGASHKPRRVGMHRKDYLELTDRGSIKRRLIYEGVLTNECSECKITTWLGQPLPLELDHIDGNPHNNNHDNLRLLCPNCHSLTPTWRGRNRKREKNDED